MFGTTECFEGVQVFALVVDILNISDESIKQLIRNRMVNLISNFFIKIIDLQNFFAFLRDHYRVQLIQFHKLVSLFF